MEKHTKGKWTVHQYKKDQPLEYAIFSGDVFIAQTENPMVNDEPTKLEKKANANLIASAPEMLEMLKTAEIRIAYLIYKMDGETPKKESLIKFQGKTGEEELNDIIRLRTKIEEGE